MLQVVVIVEKVVVAVVVVAGLVIECKGDLLYEMK